MNLNQALNDLKQISVEPDEVRLQATICRGKQILLQKEQDKCLSYQAFLWDQLRYTRKRWWVLQALLLAFAALSFQGLDIHHIPVRSIGVIGCLFVVLIIPELWRNKESCSTQVEAACLYSLRQIYSARITLFGLVDVFFLTLFSVLLGRMGLAVIDVVSQFLLPMSVTACICFGLLCGKRNWNETVSVAACMLWSAAWWLILMNEQIYTRIAPSVWAVLFGITLVVLSLTIRRSVRTTNQYWEVNSIGTTIG